MNKILLVFALLAAFAGIAAAQDPASGPDPVAPKDAIAPRAGVTIYGRLDMGLVVDSGPAGRSVRLTGGVAKGNDLGFKGSEDLGGGYRAGFVAETGYCADSTTSSGSGTTSPPYCTGSNFMGRGTHVDLYGPFGGINVGRQYPVGHSYLMLVDPFGGGTAGQVLNLADVSGPYVSNAIRYMAPTLGGFNFAVELGLGEPSHGSWADGRENGASLIYGSGPASVGLTLYEVRNSNGFESARRNVLLGGWYDFGVVKVHAMAQRSTGHPTGVALPIDVLDLMAGLTVPAGAGKVMATYTHHDDRTSFADHGDQDAHQWALGYLYWLTRRVSIYAAWARITNQNGGKLTVGNPSEHGTGNESFNLGMAYDF
jgi:predicted porin